MDNKFALYANTIKYLKPSQVYHRLYNALKKELFKRKVLTIKVLHDLEVKDNGSYSIPELDFDKEYLDKFNVDDIFKSKFTFINLTNQVELSTAWNNNRLQHLWRYNLHYFEYLYKLAYEYTKNNQIEYYEKFKDLIINWIDNNPIATGDGWHPYTISLRITNWISTYQIFIKEINLDIEFNKRLKKSLFMQYRYLQSNLEKDVLGNHYFENIKALIIGSIFFEDDKVKRKFKKELLKQLRQQILEDGMHFELSLMYHKIILEDLIKITYWLKDDEDVYEDLIFQLQKMIDVIYSFEKDFGKTPAFNDSADAVSKHYMSLLNACKKHFELSPVAQDDFEESGYYIVKDSSKKLIFDTGEICPAYLPAHGHCDALSFELAINSSPFIVNSGTYQYESGRWRDYFRSTKAHNTVTVSNREQSQFWGSFRVAKRIKNVRRKSFIFNNTQFYAGKYITYSGDEHKRFIGYLDEDIIIILDNIISNSQDNTQSYVHFIPGTSVIAENDIVQAIKDDVAIKIMPFGTRELNVEQGWYSNQFNIKEKNQHIILHKKKNAKYFGYIINFNLGHYKIIELENGVQITGDIDMTINYDQLGVML